MEWAVYILRCADDTLYTGITNDLEARIAKHASGTGAKYTRGRGPYSLIHTEFYPSRSAATQREQAIKSLSRENKMMLAAAGHRKKAPS